MLNPDTFGFPVITETVAGAWVEKVVRGDPALEAAYVAAARLLVDRGAVAISSTCGFTIRYQHAVAAAVDVPVGMSSLLLLPALLNQLPESAKIAVLTFDTTELKEDLLGLDTLEQRQRVVIGGIEGGKYWKDELTRPPPPIDVAAMEADLEACIAGLRAANPDIGAILFECAGFPLVGATIRRKTRLPVYDITTICRVMLASVHK